MKTQPLLPAPSPKRRRGGSRKQPLPLAPSPKRRGGGNEKEQVMASSPSSSDSPSPFRGGGRGEGLHPPPSSESSADISASPSPKRRGGRGEGLTPPPARNIVVGQRIAEEKIIRAKQFRRQLTPAERRLWECLRRNQLNGLHFRRQQVIEGFIVDFYCHSTRLVVEVDGSIHELQSEADAERERIFVGFGLRVLRFTNEDVLLRTDAVLRQISLACGRVDNPSPRPPPRSGEGEEELPESSS